MDELSIRGFVVDLASGEPTPGGGSAAALAGAVAASLSAMVARLTEGREKYRDSWAKMADLRDRADSAAARLLELMILDSRAYEGVMAAMKLPKGTDLEKAERTAAVQASLAEAALTPLKTLQAAADICGLVEEVLQFGNPNCLTDAGTAVWFARTAAEGAYYNVRINLGGLKDEALKQRLTRESDQAVDLVRTITTRLALEVSTRLS
jgi:glutamate formiminotransferase/formiminotetrahydrofolate cyclodeaminase